MTKVKLNLASGSSQERELVTAFNYADVKYVIFDGESTGSMGLPIILVGKEVVGKVVGITDAEEWKNTKECLKKIIAGEKVDYAKVGSELDADDIYYRQLTLPIASFDVLKSSYVEPEEAPQAEKVVDETPVFEQINPEDISINPISNVEPVTAQDLNAEPVFTPDTTPVVPQVSPQVEAQINAEDPVGPTFNDFKPLEDAPKADNNYDVLKEEFMKAAEKLFDDLYKKINHND